MDTGRELHIPLPSAATADQLLTLAGALVGAGMFGAIYTRVQAWFRLPPLALGTGDG